MTKNSRRIVAAVVACATAACTIGAAQEAPALGRSLERSLVRGTRVEAAVTRGFTSRTNRTGETVQASVIRDVMNDRGRVVIPSGSTVSLTIDQIAAESPNDPDGQLVLSVGSVTVNGEAFPVTARLDPVAFHLQGRGSTGRDAAVTQGTSIVFTLSQTLNISSR